MEKANDQLPEPIPQFAPPNVPISSEGRVAIEGRYDNNLCQLRAVRPIVVQGDGADLGQYGLQIESWYRHASQRMSWGPTGDMPVSVARFPANVADTVKALDLGLQGVGDNVIARTRSPLPGANDWPRGVWAEPGTAANGYPAGGMGSPSTVDGTLGRLEGDDDQ